MDVAPLKAQALLGYLATGRETSSRKLAELLWEPDRLGSVHQAIHILRSAHGSDAWLQSKRGQIAVRARSDAALFERLIRRGRPAAALTLWRSTPYEGLKVPDAPDFEEWLQGERHRLEHLHREALHLEMHRCEHIDATAEAFDLAHSILSQDPLDETAHRVALRLHLRRGDLRAARKAFEYCRQILDAELGTEPLPETQELGDAVAAGERAITLYSPLRSLGQVPPALLRPPFVGRHREVAAVHEAWADGAIAVIVSPGGMGKSRLVLDVAMSAGAHLYLDGRAGDAGVPFMSLSRMFSTLLKAMPDVELPSWVLDTVGRYAATPLDSEQNPELPGRTWEPANSTGRTVQALSLLLSAARSELEVLVIDDLHLFDRDSLAILLASLADLDDQGAYMVIAARDDEMDTDSRRMLHGYTEAGQASQIRLSPLDAKSVAELLETMTERGQEAFADELVRYTGGNPLFVVETLRALHRDRELHGLEALPESFSTPQRISSVLEHRLERLSTPSLRTARVLALAPGSSADFVADVLDLAEHTVAESLGSLEAEQLLDDGALAHDVVATVVRDHTPASVQQVLHSRIAHALAARARA